MIKNITFGSDPEYFIINNDINQIISSIPLIKGNKEFPEPLGDGYSILTDNILAEGNIPPTDNPMRFLENLLELKHRINKYLQDQYPQLSVYHEDCMDINPVFLTDPGALEFGCSPYLNAWDMKEHRANDLSRENFRTCGLHIHIGYSLEPYNPYNKETFNIIMARAFDMFVTIPAALHHYDKRRFFNYGGLGQFRNTAYGLECRSLGGYFVDDKYLPWVIEQTCRMLTFVKDEVNARALLTMEKPEISEDLTFDRSIYSGLGINLNNQLITINKTENVYTNNN